MQFVQDMNHESLKMEKLEFEAYTSGDLVPPLNVTNCDCTEAIGAMEKTLSKVRTLIEKQHEMTERIDQLEMRISLEQVSMASEFEKTLSLLETDNFVKLNTQVCYYIFRSN